MIEKFRLFIVTSCFALSCIIPFTAEARGGFNGIITQIKDPKAMEAYAKEIQQLVELYEQGKKMQTQIEQLQQSLEHYKFTDLQQTYNFLTDTVESAEKIQKRLIYYCQSNIRTLDNAFARNYRKEILRCVAIYNCLLQTKTPKCCKKNTSVCKI